MMNIIKLLFKRIFDLVYPLIATILTVIYASKKDNLVYEFIDTYLKVDITLKKIILAAVITCFVGLLRAIIDFIYFVVLKITSKYFKKVIIDVVFKENKRKKVNLKFTANNNNYEEKYVDIELNITPPGKILAFALRFLGLKLEIFFNPEIIDIFLKDDQIWANHSKVASGISPEQRLYINLLGGYRDDGNTVNPYLITECLIIMPKRVKKATSTIDFKFKSFIGNKIIKSVCILNIEQLLVECEGN